MVTEHYCHDAFRRLRPAVGNLIDQPPEFARSLVRSDAEAISPRAAAADHIYDRQ
jgi:hypothetical protein